MTPRTSQSRHNNFKGFHVVSLTHGHQMATSHEPSVLGLLRSPAQAARARGGDGTGRESSAAAGSPALRGTGVALLWDRHGTRDTLLGTCPPPQDGAVPPAPRGAARETAPRHSAGASRGCSATAPVPLRAQRMPQGTSPRGRGTAVPPGAGRHSNPRAKHAAAGVMPSGSGFVTTVLSWQSLAATPEPKPDAAARQPHSSSGLSSRTAPPAPTAPCIPRPGSRASWRRAPSLLAGSLPAPRPRTERTGRCLPARVGAR